MADREEVSEDAATTVETLEKDLASERAKVEKLQQSLAKLKRRVNDQKERIEALARGREQSMNSVGQLRDELRLVSNERDKLRQQLTALESMQTETQTLDESEIGDETDAHQGALPSIDELMANFSGDSGNALSSHSTLQVESGNEDATGDYQEMISPEMIVLGSSRERVEAPNERYLVLLEDDKQTKCPLDQELMTIGRSDSADIKIEGDFISRIHARILRIGMDSVVEDAGSRNGTRVNTELVERHVLKHGDLVRVGSANFRFVDSAAPASDAD